MMEAELSTIEGMEAGHKKVVEAELSTIDGMEANQKAIEAEPSTIEGMEEMEPKLKGSGDRKAIGSEASTMDRSASPGDDEHRSKSESSRTHGQKQPSESLIDAKPPSGQSSHSTAGQELWLRGLDEAHMNSSNAGVSLTSHPHHWARTNLRASLLEVSARVKNPWIGSVLYKYGVTQAFAAGEGCSRIPGIDSIDGPSGLPDYLAYFAYQVTNGEKNIPGPTQIQKVSKAFRELLPESSVWHTIKIELDMTGSECMVQDKLHFSPKGNMCHVGIVWSGEDGTNREFWIVSYGGGHSSRQRDDSEDEELDEDDSTDDDHGDDDHEA